MAKDKYSSIGFEGKEFTDEEKVIYDAIKL